MSAMHTVESLRLIPVWVNPEHLVATARLLMTGHHLKTLAVLDGQKLVGTVGAEQASGVPENTPVSAVLVPLSVIVPAGMTVREAAELFISEHVDSAPVLRDEKFIGMLTSQLLLRELKHSWDPLTSLPWSDRLRDWGTENLKHGREITILFFDINDFGLYNKRHGHVVGDKVLRMVAEAFSTGVESDTDVLVRYGGDEFAVGTTRSRADAEALASSLMIRAGSVFLEESAEAVTLSMGLYGGKRTQERENVHFAATLDNLINLASKDCLSKKRSSQQSLPIEPEPETAAPSQPTETVSPPKTPVGPLPQVVGVYSDENSPNSLTIVILNVAGTVLSGVHQRAGKTVLQSIAAATGKALQRVRRDTLYVVEDILMVEDSMGDKFISVTGKTVRDGKEQAVSGILKIGEDLYRSAVEATLHAFQGEI